MNLDELKTMWKEDCKVDDIELDTSSLEVPKLHAKYSELLTDASIQLKNSNLKYQLLLKDKWLWFHGKMDQSKIKELGWQDDPFDGLKIMKNDMPVFFDADPDLQKARAQIEYFKEVIDFLKRAMDNITWRHQTIKNIIEWRKFMSGA